MNVETFERRFASAADDILGTECMMRNAVPEYAYSDDRIGVIRAEKDDGSQVLHFIDDFSDKATVQKHIVDFAKAVAGHEAEPIVLVIITIPGRLVEVHIGDEVEVAKETDIYVAQAATMDREFMAMGLFTIQSDMTGRYWKHRPIIPEDDASIHSESLVEVFRETYRATRARMN